MTKLYAYQDEGVDLLHMFKGRAILADQTGLGKSIQALTFTDEVKGWPCVIACPAFLKKTWEYEVREHLQMRAEVLEGTRIRRGHIIPPHKIIIVNYDILYAWLPFLIEKVRPVTLINDEARKVKNPTSRMGESARELSRLCKHVIHIDATPIQSRPRDLWHLLNMLYPEKYESFAPFAMKYCGPRLVYGRWVFDGATNLDHLHKKLKKLCLIRRLKKHVMKDLPPKRHLPVPLEINKRKQYESEVESVKRWVRTVFDKTSKEHRMKQKAMFGELLQTTALAKLPAVMDWLENFLEESDEKLLVFGIHRAVLEQLHEKYDNSVLIYGSTSKKKRQQAVYDFEHNKNTRLLFANMQVAGAGWSCKATSTVAVVELPWTPADLEQITSRVHGIGRGVAGQRVTCYYLVAAETCEEGLLRMLQRKEKIMDNVLEGTGTVDQTSIYDEFTKLVLQQQRKAA